MAKHHQHFTRQLAGYLSDGKGKQHKHKWHHKQQQLPDALKLSVLRGESLFRLRFFRYFESKGFDDNFAYLAYQKMLVESHVITDFVQHIGLQQASEDYIQTGLSHENSDYNAQCYQRYCLLIDRLDQDNAEQLLTDATVGLIQHYFPSFFPKATQVKPSLEVLRKQLRKALNQQWHCQVTIKESFTTSEESATMKLIAHVDQCHPTELICVQAKRVRSARFQAYHQLLEKIDHETMDIYPTPKSHKR